LNDIWAHPSLMNAKLTEEGRQLIHRMLDTMSHEEIAERMGVCARTIDREAAYWEAHTVTIKTIKADGRPIASSVRVGEEVRGTPIEEAVALAERIAAELEGAPCPIGD